MRGRVVGPEIAHACTIIFFGELYDHRVNDTTQLCVVFWVVSVLRAILLMFIFESRNIAGSLL